MATTARGGRAGKAAQEHRIIPSEDPEEKRLAVLRGLDIMDTPPERAFDDVARLAIQVSGRPFAVLSFVDNVREWVKAQAFGRSDTAREGLASSQLIIHASLAARAVADSADFFVFADAGTESTSENPSSPVRMYAAAPLLMPCGARVGVLAVIDDRVSDAPDAEQIEALQALARQTVALLELRRRVSELGSQAVAQSRSEEAARWQAGHDVLTGLPNRGLFLERVESALQRSAAARDVRTAAVLFVDLDRFKRINDTLGHAAGDTLLREVAGRFAGCLHTGDTLARLGGDEFTVLLPAAPDDVTYAANVAQMLLRTLRRPVVLGTQEFHVGASIGIALAPRDGEDAQTLLKHADIAMYQAKATGGYQSYSRRMNADGYQKLIEESELRRALERDELSLCYQPEVDLATGAFTGVEALARWQHPQRGAVPPSHFIRIAEQADLIAPLGDWVLRRACADAAEWRRRGRPDLRVAVNLSARQLTQPRLLQTIAKILEENALPGSALDLELTETALFANGDDTPAMLQEMRAMGIRLVVDDFGTGYSSLAYLRRFPVDVIKIDRAFVVGLGQETPDEPLVRALIEMAHALHLQVVAEGVETETQAAVLRRLNCDQAQGYLFSRPVTSDILARLLSGRRPQPAITSGLLSGRGDETKKRPAAATPLLPGRTRRRTGITVSTDLPS